MPAAFRTRQKTAAVQRLVETNKAFKSYLDLPQELRTMVINRMKPKTRLDFSDCSNMCREDVLKSKNIIDKIALHAYDVSHIECAVDYVNPKEVGNNDIFGFKLVFRKQGNAETMSYVRMNKTWVRSRTLWTSQIESRSDSPAAFIRFKTLLRKLRHKVKGIHLSGSGMEDLEQHLKFDVFPMRNVEKICFLANLDVCQFLTKTQQPLKSLIYAGDQFVENIPNCEQIYHAEELEVPDVHFTYKQFLKISAETIVTHIGQITVKNMVDYIREWQHGKRDHLKKCLWNFENTNFNVGQVFSSFDAEFPQTISEMMFVTFSVGQMTNSSKRATISYIKDEESDSIALICVDDFDDYD